MPIRFRCAYCNQLMAIARRKSGTVVKCPTCAGQVVVPSTEPAPAPPGPTAAGPPPRVANQPFERSDFDEIFRDEPRPHGALAPGPASVGSQVIDVEPIPIPEGTWTGQAPAGMVLTAGKTTLLGIVVLILLGLAFVAGLLIGMARSTP